MYETRTENNKIYTLTYLCLFRYQFSQNCLTIHFSLNYPYQFYSHKTICKVNYLFITLQTHKTIKFLVKNKKNKIYFTQYDPTF